MHDEIKKFTIGGIVGDEADLADNKETLMHWLEGDMRDQGFVPVLDIDPQHTVQFDVDNERFNFVLSTYGVFVGEGKSWQIAGMMHGKIIWRYIPKSRLKESWSSAK